MLISLNFNYGNYSHQIENRVSGGQKVGGSNPLAPTRRKPRNTTLCGSCEFSIWLLWLSDNPYSKGFSRRRYTLPKLNNRPPKYSKLKKYAVVYYHGKTIYLGDYGSPESHTAYSRFVAESQANPTFYLSKVQSVDKFFY